MTSVDPQDKRLEELKQKLNTKLGIAGAMASHSKATATRLKAAAEHHHGHAQDDLTQLAGQIRASGVGMDEEAEAAYCRRLMDRHRMQQTYSLAEQDEARFPDITPHEKHLEKSLHRLPPDRIEHPYRHGTLQERTTEEPDDFQVRLYDPKELLPREPERDKHPEKVAFFTDLFARMAPEQIDPLVLVRTETGREILDGHHRWHGACEAEKPVPAIEVSEAEFLRLKGLGFSDMDLCYAVLAKGDCWDAADKVKGQFDGRSVRHTGFLAYEHLGKAVMDDDLPG